MARKSMDKREKAFQEYISSELPTERFLRHFFDPGSPLVIFDIGACEGEDSIRYARLFPRSSVYSFEPVAENAEKARANLKKHGLKNVRLTEKALSDAAGSRKIYLSSGQPENSDPAIDRGNKSSSILKPGKVTEETYPWLRFSDERVIECSTLADFCSKEGIPEIDFIHMDVQGAELLVLKGAGEKIATVKALWLEVSASEFYENQALEGEIDAFMREKGFRMIGDTLRGGSYGDYLYANMRLFPAGRMAAYRIRKAARDGAARIGGWAEKLRRLLFGKKDRT